MIPRNLLITIAVLLVAVLGMVLYGFHLRQQAMELQQRASDLRPISPPVIGPAETIIVFLPNDDHGTLVRRELTAKLPTEPTLRARDIVRLLINACQEKSSPHLLGNEADVKEVFLLNKNRTAVVDVNAAFADQHRSGILVEELTIASLARSLGANINGVTEMKIIVEGRERETLAGHADLGGFYSTNLDWQTE